MARSKENWAAFFKRSDRKKKVTKRKSASLLSTVGGVVEPHVIGELISVRSYRPILVRKSHILTNSEKRRANPTRAEAELQRVLNSLNGGALRGKFKREHVVSGKWIVDFFFPKIRLAIEVDGSVHNTQVQRAKDLKKDSDCRRFDITVLRLRNAEIFGDRDWLIKKLRAGWREAKDRENRIIGTSA
jgi:very-short-patch-repair endonuclease